MLERLWPLTQGARKGQLLAQAEDSSALETTSQAFWLHSSVAGCVTSPKVARSLQYPQNPPQSGVCHPLVKLSHTLRHCLHLQYA